MVRETHLASSNLVMPLFVTEGSQVKTPISSLPGQFRMSSDHVLETCREIVDLGIESVALFPHIHDSKKDPLAQEALNPNGLIPNLVRLIKKSLPSLVVITDVAMDPYSSDGHDGVYKEGQILNDETLRILAGQAIVQAEAGADFVAPSDMMDGRVGYIREALDQKNLADTGIISYAAKYASSFYGPFREALDSAPRSGDKKTYQMDPGNSREALREVQMDLAEGADMVMVKPALSYLDIIQRVKQISLVPVCAYNVSAEYAMVKAMGQLGWGDPDRLMEEVLISIRRAGADIIFSYHAMEMAKILATRRP
jgi:porphobilinogen synthase